MVTGTQECEQSNTDCRQAGGGQHRVMTALEIGNRTFEIESRRRAQQAVDHALPVAGLVPALKRGEVRVQDGGGVINGGVDHAMVRPARAAGGHRNGRLTGFCFLFFHAEIPGLSASAVMVTVPQWGRASIGPCCAEMVRHAPPGVNGRHFSGRVEPAYKG